MSNFPANEFAALVRDARTFIQSQLRSLPVSTQPERPSLPKVKAIEPPQVVPLLSVEPQTPPPSPKPKAETPPPLKKGNWELQAMLPSGNPSEIRKKLSAHTQLLEPPLDVVIVLPEENALNRLFLENVSRAVTRSFASASVVLYHENLWQNTHRRCILAPTSLLQQRFPKAQPHIPIQEGSSTWIPLENLEIYAHDVNHKRALWMSIQRLFQS